MARFHGFSDRTGENQPLGEFSPTGKFGRMFPKLRPFTPAIEDLVKLAEAMVDTAEEAPAGDNPKVPAGYTYLGQFVDHDITFDTTTLKETRVDPLAIRNFRTPALDLDSLYGAGPANQPYLYEFAPGFSPQEKFQIGLTHPDPGNGDPSVPVLQPNDLLRAPGSNFAIIGDPRNDENLIVAQTHVAFLKFHNRIVDKIKSQDGTIPVNPALSTFDQARELVTWHYQWIVLHDFLRRILDPDQLDKVLMQGRSFYQFETDAFIPVEFSVAAYRLGHSMIRAAYDYNRVFTPLPGGVVPATLQLLFAFTKKSNDPSTDPGAAFARVPIPSDWIIDWRRFFEMDAAVGVNLSRKLDPFLTDPLRNLPNVPNQELPGAPSAPTNALAVRNLLRGRSVGLPSGQSVAEYMGFKPLTPDQIARGTDGARAKELGFDVQTPLWYYILKEAEVQQNGERLGQVGSRIIAEVFVGLLEGDSTSFLVRNRQWKPTLPAKVYGTFTMADLIAFMGDISPIDGIRA